MIKKKMTKNMILKNMKKAQFSTATCFSTNEDRRRFGRKITELNQERRGLLEDLDLVKDAVRAASKLENQEEPSNEEQTCLDRLKQNYVDFFDSDEDPETDEEQNNKKGKEKENQERSHLTKIMELKAYLRNELSFNTKNINELKKNERARLIEQDVLSKTSLTKKQDQESSVKPTVETKDSSSKPSSSKDDLDSYNPFDDIGFD